MSKWNKGLMTAMEEFEEAELTSVTGTETGDTEVLEMTQSAAIMTDHANDMDEAVSSAIDLQAIADAIQSQDKMLPRLHRLPLSLLIGE